MKPLLQTTIFLLIASLISCAKRQINDEQVYKINTHTPREISSGARHMESLGGGMSFLYKHKDDQNLNKLPAADNKGQGIVHIMTQGPAVPNSLVFVSGGNQEEAPGNKQSLQSNLDIVGRQDVANKYQNNNRAPSATSSQTFSQTIPVPMTQSYHISLNHPVQTPHSAFPTVNKQSQQQQQQQQPIQNIQNIPQQQYIIPIQRQITRPFQQIQQIAVPQQHQQIQQPQPILIPIAPQQQQVYIPQHIPQHIPQNIQQNLQYRSPQPQTYSIPVGQQISVAGHGNSGPVNTIPLANNLNNYNLQNAPIIPLNNQQYSPQLLQSFPVGTSAFGNGHNLPFNLGSLSNSHSLPFNQGQTLSIGSGFSNFDSVLSHLQNIPSIPLPPSFNNNNNFGSNGITFNSKYFKNDAFNTDNEISLPQTNIQSIPLSSRQNLQNLQTVQSLSNLQNIKTAEASVPEPQQEPQKQENYGSESTNNSEVGSKQS